MKDLSLASTKESNCHVSIDIPKQRSSILQRVPTQVRELQGKNQIYEPVLVSLGPYHHGRLSQFKQVEDLKLEILHLPFPDSCSGKQQQQLLGEIRDRLGEVRSFYNELSRDDFDDEALAQMMLRDACFLVYCMKKMADHDENCIVLDRLGMSRLAFVVRDFFMLENQLPFFILRKVISLTRDDKVLDDKDKDKDKVNDKDKAIDVDVDVDIFYSLLTSMLNCGDNCSSNQPPLAPKSKQTTLHLLDACRTILVENMKAKGIHSHENNVAATANSQFRSVTDLKAKGIHFRPTKSNYSYCLRDITFTSHSFYGMLRLPILLLDNKTNVILSNIVAMEMSPPHDTDFAVTSYVKFMKSLIMKAEDVKELREKGIVVSCLGDDEEVVKMFRELNTEGSCRKDIFRGIRESINEHCRSKTKTFKAELLHTYFRSPWTAIALLAAILILCVNCLNFLLNYYKFSRPVKPE